MSPKVFILIGRSGSGKGTQADLLKTYLKKIDHSRETLYIQTGEEFRQFIKEKSITARLAKEIYDKGELEPEFLSIYMWVKALISSYTGNEHILMDGMPRRSDEDSILHSVFKFYNIGKPFVVHIDISEKEATKRLLLRKRGDDEEKNIKRRLEWYNTEVIPTLEAYRHDEHCTLIEVSGEGSVEEIHKRIVEKIGLVG